MQASRPSSETYFRQSYIPGHSNMTIEPEMHFITTTILQQVLSNPTVLRGLQLHFSLGEEGGKILVVTRVSVLHHGVHQMMQYRLYQGLLYFQNVIQFQGTHINVI